MKLKKIIITLFALFFLAATLNAGEFQETNCILYNSEEKEVRLSDFKGKSLILWFWTTWCPYCREAIPDLNSIYPELKSAGIELLAVNVDEPKEKIVRFIKHYPIDFNILQDKGARCAFSYGVIGVPTYILIDKNGKVRFKQNYFSQDKYKELLTQ